MLAHLELGFYKYSRRAWNFLFFYIRNRNCTSKLDCGLMLLAGHEWMVDWILFCTFTTIQSWCATNILEQLQMVQNLSIAHWLPWTIYSCVFSGILIRNSAFGINSPVT
ncbi:hypothetical protein PRUPE_3G131800 [Prunus persica]|uniref:Uncharacterized protein n=2 Tax=Prunus persica TaxID=3760 RepID=A0A251PZN8_PRUPE|nr:hypothetical protein PRUPE_3G131800 [Prunus persica]ONI16942.1 hypothetical protein PRUPE_3G131800 [Prunus persica]